MFSFHPQKIGALSEGNDNYNEGYDNDLFWYSSLILEMRGQTDYKKEQVYDVHSKYVLFLAIYSRLVKTVRYKIMWGIFIIIFDETSIHFNELKLEDMY